LAATRRRDAHHRLRVRAILAHLSEPTSPPGLAPARGPPLWEMPDAGKDRFAPRPSQHRITNSISASRGKDSLTKIRSRSSGTARAMGHQSYPSIRREVFGRIGLFDETMVRNQDIEFTARARAAGDFTS